MNITIEDIQTLLQNLGQSLEGPGRYLFDLAVRNNIIWALLPVIGTIIATIVALVFYRAWRGAMDIRSSKLVAALEEKWTKDFGAYQTSVEDRFTKAVSTITTARDWSQRPSLRFEFYTGREEITDREQFLMFGAIIATFAAVGLAFVSLFALPNLLNPEWAAVNDLVNRLSSLVP